MLVTKNLMVVSRRAGIVVFYFFCGFLTLTPWLLFIPLVFIVVVVVLHAIVAFTLVPGVLFVIALLLLALRIIYIYTFF